MDLVITGAAGFIGSHVLLEWMCRHQDARALCFVRASSRGAARARILNALERAIGECGLALPVRPMMERIDVIDADLTDLRWRADPGWIRWTGRSPGFEVIHGAASLSFKDEDREAVWRTNVDGTVNFFNALVGLEGLRHFNYLSTAYVAGCAEGEIAERVGERPEAFNNPYEESKWTAEHAIVRIATEHGVGHRIFRPSIVIGHSATHRVGAKTGFYKVVETLLAMGANPAVRAETILVPINRNAGLNLIPIDFVVAEMMDVIAAGPESAGRVFHLTNERPLSVADLFLAVLPLTGMRLQCVAEYERPTTRHSALVARGFRHYMPYLRHSRSFDRANVRALGAGRQQARHWLDASRLREHVTSFIAAERRGQSSQRQVSA